MFGGGGGFAGGYGGYGGTMQAPPESESDRPNAFGGGSFGGGNQEAGGFNAVPSGAGFGGAGFGAAPNVQASQGLGGYLRAPGQNDNADGPRMQGGQREGQSLMPLTIRMLLDAHERMAHAGPDAPLMINGKEIFVFTFVACLESLELESVYKVFKVNDGTGRITAKKYSSDAPAGQDEDLQVGEYVRVFGSLRLWNGDFHISAHHVGRLENPNEVPFHFIEVAHVHLAMAGKIQSKAPPAVGAQGGGSASSSTCFKCGQPGHWAKDCPGSVGSLPPTVGNQSSFPPPGQQQPGMNNTFPGAPGSFGAVRSTAPAPHMGGGSSAGQSGGCFKCGQSGHWARDCPNAGPGAGAPGAPQRAGGTAGAGECFKCGQPGHWARDCPGSSTAGSFAGSSTSPGLGLSGAYGGGMNSMGSGVQRFEPF